MVVTFHYVLRGCVSASLGDFLESADAEYDGDTDQVGDRARVDQQQSAGDTRNAQRPVHVVKGIAFGQSASARYIKSKRSFDIAYTLEDNVFKHNAIQLQIEDIRPAEDEKV